VGFARGRFERRVSKEKGANRWCKERETLNTRDALNFIQGEDKKFKKGCTFGGSRDRWVGNPLDGSRAGRVAVLNSARQFDKRWGICWGSLHFNQSSEGQRADVI